MKFPSWPELKGFRDIKLGLSRVKKIAKRLNISEENLPPIIHIAGTNGKGSCASYLQAILKDAGYSCHVYTSPHLVEFNERILLNDREIADDFLNENLDQVKQACQKPSKVDVTFFEGVTLAAFLAFSKIPADILILEVGMGGNLDATNIIEKPLASIITTISFDHQKFLGEKINEIACQKAGIIKENCPVFVSKNQSKAILEIENQIKAKKTIGYFCNQDFTFNKEKDFFTFKGMGRQIKLPLPNLPGDHQLENASCAIACLLGQNYLRINTQNIANGITSAKIKGRLQKIDYGRFYRQKNANTQIYIDGAHNPIAAKHLANFISDHDNNYLVIGMLKDKNANLFLKSLLSKDPKKIKKIVFTKIQDPFALDPFRMDQLAYKYKIPTQICDNITHSMGYLFANISPDKNARILVLGSLYLVGEFLEINQLA